MSLRYVVGINIVVVGDGENTVLAFDLLKDYSNVAGLGYKGGWIKGKLPSKVAAVAGSSGYDIGLKKGGSVVYITFPSPPPLNAQISVNVNLLFDSESDDEEIEEAKESGRVEPQNRDLDRATGFTSGE